MLRETKQLLAKHGRLTLRELARHFDMDAGALEKMLETLVDKGQIRLVAGGCAKPCAGCTSACREDMLIYELNGNAEKRGEKDQVEQPGWAGLPGQAGRRPG
ncbi:FeoC-like transcriptional regulator [Kiritimatiella glycovorans]|uniref:FeoC like transcriptional regulator n=1 Tax=Kiritimatiella glycovorans TaxID=1307763 RepID=A0A0G3EJ96_9BACT|nr:FeoC-like transcriptional regulator [Kiritimatiella glycovorans]AKJ64850.1 FeoC like transcriptional regulator [Kiritimatiella glycovorans]